MSYVIWLTGLSSSGKTTLARALHQELRIQKNKVIILDGDDLRKTISSDLGFSKEDRETHNRRVISLAEKYSIQGYIVIVALISPYNQIRQEARKRLNNFVEIYLKCPLEVCKMRDTKDLYRRFEDGQISGLAGLDMPYEVPKTPEVMVCTDEMSVVECVERILQGCSSLFS